MRMLVDLARLLAAVLAPMLKHAAYMLPGALLLASLFARDTCACSTTADAYRVVMRVDLRFIVRLQESRRAAGEGFLDSLPPAVFRHQSGVELVHIRATADGFDAEVGFPSRTKNRCRISHRWGQDALPSCDYRRRYEDLWR